MDSLLEQIVSRIQSLKPSEITVTPYTEKRAAGRRIDVETACKNIVSRTDGVWRFSSFLGLKGKRIEAYFKVSARNAHKYVIEVNQKIYLINVMNINTRIQRRLKRNEDRYF